MPATIIEFFFFLVSRTRSNMDPVTLARLSAGPPPSPVVSESAATAGLVGVSSVEVDGVATALGACGVGAASPPRGGSPPPRPTAAAPVPIPGGAGRRPGKENSPSRQSAGVAGVSPPPRAGSIPYGASPPSSLMGRSTSVASPPPVAPYQALPVHGPVTITHHLTAGLPVVEPGEMSHEVRERQGEWALVGCARRARRG